LTNVELAHIGQACNIILRIRTWRKGKRRRNKGRKKIREKESKNSVTKEEQE
jgi:hypothetical protein